MFHTVRLKVKESMGLKFALALSGWIALAMFLGTLAIGRLFLDYQYRTVEARGRETAAVLGKAIIDRLIASDIIGLNMLVEDVVKSRGILSVVIVNADGAPLTSAKAGFNTAIPELRELVSREQTEDVRKLAAALRKELNPIEVSVEVTLEGARLGEARIAFSRAEARSNAMNIIFLLAGTSILIVLSISVIVYYMVRRMIVVPTRFAESVATSIAAGDLTRNVRVVSNDEIGYLGRGLNRMVIGLKEMVGSVRQVSSNLETVSTDVATVSVNINTGSRVQAESVEEAASSVNEMHFSLKEIAANIEDLNATSEQTSSSVIETAASIDEVARTMNELTSSIEETSTAITQMSASIGNIAENVSAMTGAVDQTSSAATEVGASVREVEASARESAALAEAVAADAQGLGMRSIDKTIEGMRRIEEETQRTAEVINRLGMRAESIGGILTVIEDITDQTSLLALNAAILAAQAGEHGKGFSVVAAEIRDLANRTAVSTKEIGKLIVSVQEESREAVEVMHTGVLLAEEGSELAREAGAALQKILDRASQARDMSQGISRAAAEQTKGMKQVADAIEHITGMSHQIAMATAEQRSGSAQITQAADRMREITRFVKSATAEQVKASKNITASVEIMSTKISLVHRATGEVRTGSDLIVKAIDRIKVAARENADRAGQLNSAVDVLTVQAAALKKELGRFTT